MFDHYFRHLYTILKFINENDWLGENKQYKYATFVRATLSRYELVMLYYNGFFHPKMKQMIERYTMLNNLRWDLLPMSLEYSRYLDTVKCSARDLKMQDSPLVISNIISQIPNTTMVDIILVRFIQKKKWIRD